jgi:Short C-terminal domain
MPGLLRGIARTAVVAGTATAVSNRVSRRQAGRWARHDAEEAPYADQPQGADQQPAAPTGDEQLTQLERLAALKQQGVLSEAEFAEQKRRILGF